MNENNSSLMVVRAIEDRESPDDRNTADELQLSEKDERDEDTNSFDSRSESGKDDDNERGPRNDLGMAVMEGRQASAFALNQ